MKEISTKPKTDPRCEECEKDWTQCGACPLLMEWVKEQREKNAKKDSKKV